MDEPSADTGPVPPSASDSDPSGAASPTAGVDRPSWRMRWKLRVLMALVIAATATLVIRRVTLSTGTSANLAKQPAADKKDSKGPTDPFTFGPFTLRPSESDRIEAGIKPGHWTMATQEVRANFDDFRGELVTEVVQAGGDGVDLDGQTFHLRSSRPAVLPKTQKKLLDIAMFNPVNHFSRQVCAAAVVAFGPRRMERPRVAHAHPGRTVFPRRPCPAAGRLPIPAHAGFDLGAARQCRGSRCAGALPRRPANRHLGGSTAQSRLVLDQHGGAPVGWFGSSHSHHGPATGAVDWLHWGGQLIVSGPDSLDLMRTPFWMA